MWSWPRPIYSASFHIDTTAEYIEWEGTGCFYIHTHTITWWHHTHNKRTRTLVRLNTNTHTRVQNTLIWSECRLFIFMHRLYATKNEYKSMRLGIEYGAHDHHRNEHAHRTIRTYIEWNGIEIVCSHAFMWATDRTTCEHRTRTHAHTSILLCWYSSSVRNANRCSVVRHWIVSYVAKDDSEKHSRLQVVWR